MNLAHTVHSNIAVGCDIFLPYLKFDNCQPEIGSDVVSRMVEQDVGMDVFANFGDSGLKPSVRHFRPFFERR